MAFLRISILKLPFYDPDNFKDNAVVLRFVYLQKNIPM